MRTLDGYSASLRQNLQTQDVLLQDMLKKAVATVEGVQMVGLYAAIKPLISHSATGHAQAGGGDGGGGADGETNYSNTPIDM
eukprot:1999503-Pyramimonas_sp.AAC.1